MRTILISLAVALAALAGGASVLAQPTSTVKAWPPVLAKGRPAAGRGAKRGLLGTTRRRDGRRQLTYRGRPLYYYVGDSPGQVLCQNVREFGGLWTVVRPDGAPVR